MQGNRSVDRPMVNKIKRSMQKWGVITCITILKNKKKYLIVDGQHRYTAAMESGLTIPAIVIPKDSIKVIIDLNTIQRSWSLENYADYFCADKKLAFNYNILKAFKEESGLNYTSAVRICSKGGLPQFKRGALVLDNMEFAEKFISYLNDISEYVPFAKNARFIDGFIRIVQNDNYSHVRMLKKLKVNQKRNTFSMDGKAKPSSYGKLMEDIYNMQQSRNLVMFHKW
tara:strand:- start:37 stop:717 length:681 start_codon:yes stop_codon:yes gene_type:complete